jgi:hypothetical protein
MTDPDIISSNKRTRPMPGWHHFEHMADIGVHGEGATLAEERSLDGAQRNPGTPPTR